MSSRSPWPWAFLAACAPLMGCIPTPPQGTVRAPNTSMPETFGAEVEEEAGADAVTEATAEQTAEEAPSSAQVDWHDFFGDPQLVALIDLAMRNNQELNITAQKNSDAKASECQKCHITHARITAKATDRSVTTYLRTA